jgi:hypothetical protein
MPAFEYLMLVKESSWGVPMAAPVLGTDKVYIRLTDGNSFTPQANPQYVDIPYGGGEDILVEALSDVFETRGTLTTRLYPDQAALILPWALTRVNTAKTQPWTQSTEPEGDLASVSIYHAYAYSNGTIKRTRYAGCKAASCRISASRGDPVFRLALDVIAQRPVGNTYDLSTDPDATEFPAPADAELPMGPYLFSESAGGLLLGTAPGVIRTQYDSLDFNVTNTLDSRPFESRFPQVIAFRGRRATVSSVLRLKATPDDRTAFESTANQRTQITITKGARSIVLDLKGQNKLRQLGRDLPLNRVYTFNMQVGNVRDPTAGTDIGLTVV